MNNANARQRVYADNRVAVERVVQPRTAVASRIDDPIRDFFRRGDRGQYEGGPADHSFESLPSLDLPERTPIIRTPQQQARRVAAMWAEAVLLAGCVVFLVAAASMNATIDNQPKVINAGQIPAQQGVRTVVQPSATAFRPSTPRARIAVADKAVVAATKPLPLAQAPAPKAAVLPKPDASVTSANATVNTRKGANIRSDTTKAIAPSVARPRQVRAATGVSQPNPAPAINSVAPKRAEASFPDD